MSKNKTYRKYAVSTLAAAAAVASVAPVVTAAETTFPDLPTSNTHYDNIIKLAELGAFGGDANGNFNPTDDLRRGQAAKVLVATAGLELVSKKEAAEILKDVSDVSENHVLALEIATAYKAGAINGYTNGSFGPDDPINRQQLAKILVEGLHLDAIDNGEKVDIDMVGVDIAARGYVQTIANLGITKGNKDGKYIGTETVQRAAFASFAVRTLDALDKVDVAPEVKSVSAINGTELLVEFNKEVDKDSAENEANYLLKEQGSVALATSAYTAELQEDGKSVLITLGTPINKDDTATFVVAIENILVKGSLTEKFPLFTQTVTISDIEAPDIDSVTAKTNSDVAKSVKINFSEPVQQPTVKINGTTKSASLSADHKTATVEDLELDASKSHTVEVVNLTDLSGNVNANISKTFNVTKDTNAPTFSVTSESDKKIILNFDKKMDASTIDTSSVLLKDEDLDTLTGDYTVTEDQDSNGKKFIIELTANPYTSKDTRKLTVMTKDTIKDSLGNKANNVTQAISLTKDVEKPVLQSVEYAKNSAGEVTNVLFKYNETVSVNTLAGLTAKDIVSGDTVKLFGDQNDYTSDVIDNGKTIKVDVTGATNATKVKNGKLEIAVQAEFVKDTAFTSNKSKAAKKVVDFGKGDTAKLEVNTVTENGRNKFIITFTDDVTYASATNPENYSVNGEKLPSDTSISFDNKKQVTVNLPAGFIKNDDSGAVLRVQNVETASETKVSTNQEVVNVDDNTGPEIDKTKSNVNSNGTLTIGFNEKVADVATVGSSADVLSDLVIFLNDKEVTVADIDDNGNGTADVPNVTATDGTGGDAGKYVLTFTTTLVLKDETAAGDKDGEVLEYFDVDGNGSYSSNDILIKKSTGLEQSDVDGYTAVGTLDINKVSSIIVGTGDTTSKIVDVNTYNSNPAANIITEKQKVTIK